MPVAGTQQRTGGARGSCVVVASMAVPFAGGADRARSRTLMQGGRTAQSVLVAAVR